MDSAKILFQKIFHGLKANLLLFPNPLTLHNASVALKAPSYKIQIVLAKMSFRNGM